jgi:anion-transporting  ArsA/GET3 family ATPase
MATRLRIITGKGGVGKTVVATAMAIAEARAGKRVLLCEVTSGDAVARLLGEEPGGSELTTMMPGLTVVDMHPHATIKEYALLVLKFQTIYKAVFENRFVRHFLRLVPSLGELTLLGKVWYHEKERDRFDLIILDAPATGHAIAMLRAPGVVMGTVPPGPLRENCRIIHELVTDHTRTEMHVVTTPEEMPVNEGIEIIQAAGEQLGIALGCIFVNQRLQPLTDGTLAALTPLGAPLYDALELRQGRIAAGEHYLERLPKRLRTIDLPLVLGGDGRETVEALARELEARPWRDAK